MSDLAARRLHLGVGLLLTLLLVGLQVEYYRHAGPLWRDEVNSFNLAAQPSYADVLANRHLDSFPLVWATLLHGWIAGVGPADSAVRGLGLLVGLAMLAALWWSGRRLGLAAPLVTLLLFGMSPSTIVYGDSVRGYGLGALALALSMGAIWAFVARPAPRTFAVALAAALLAMQTYFPNGVLLFAIFAGAGAVCLRRRDWRTLMAAVAMAVIAAASLLIDVFWIVYAFGVGELEQGTYSFTWLLDVFRQALASDVPFLAICWAAAGILAAIGCGLAWGGAHTFSPALIPRSLPPARGAGTLEVGAATGDTIGPLSPSKRNDLNKDLALFVSVTACVALASYFAYLKYIAQLPTQFWYYLSLMALLALACDVGDVVIGTLGKALGLMGAFASGPDATVDLILNRARSFVFATGISPAIAAAVPTAVALARAADGRRAALLAAADALSRGLLERGYDVRPGKGPILPVWVGDTDKALALSHALWERGVVARAIRPPTVPVGTARLRLVPTAASTLEQVRRALDAFP